MESTFYPHLAVAIALGLLVGLQRERASSGLGGIRTFPLIAVLGVLCGTLVDESGGWLVAAGLVSVAGITIMANMIRLRQDDTAAGITTEIAILVMFGIGVALAQDLVLEATVAGACVAVILHWKAPLHRFAQRMGPQDFAALMRLALIALVVLPVLPNESYGPYQVLNPFQIWLIVVLIVGISMAGYVVFKLVGERTGAIAAGVLGGLISSTATTVSYARRTSNHPQRSPAAAIIVSLASTVVFGRVLVEIAIVAPGILPSIAGPLAATAIVMLLVSGGLFLLGTRSDELEVTDPEPPSEFGSAIAFGLLYAFVLLAVAFAEDRFGASGLYAVAALSGLTDMDAITISTAQLMKNDGIDLATGWRMILVGSLANIVFKGAIVMAFGSPQLRRRIGVAFGCAVAGGAAIIAFWPG